MGGFERWKKMPDPQWLTDDKKYVTHRGAPENEALYEKNVLDALVQAHAHIDELRKALDYSDASDEAEALLFRAAPPCVHEWEVIDSITGEMSVHGSEDVVCKKCQISGERDGRTGEVCWPAT